MAKASLNNIYDRLNGVASYHPFTADTFADWSLEAGDIVTIGRDGQNITSPVSSTTIRWNGSQQVSIESRGEKERESVAKMSAKAFNSGGNGGAGFRSGGRRTTQEKDMYTDLKMSDKEIEAFAVDKTNELEGKISIQADRISIVVEGTGANAHVKPAVIEAAITDSGGYLSSSIKISASKVMIDGTTAINQVMVVGSGRIAFTKPITVSSGGTSNSVMLGATGLTVNSRHFDVADVDVNDNILTITYWDGSTKNFSKATTLSGKWSGGTYTVTAKQNNETVNTNETKIKQLTQNGSVSVIGKNVGQNVHVYATENGGSNSVSTGFSQEVWIDATEVFNNGKAEGAGQYSLFGYFDKYGTVSVEGQTYTSYITQSTSASASHLALYRK